MKPDKKNLLVFHNALAPYRVDFFNALHKAYNAHFYFDLANVSDQKFDQNALKSKCNFECNYLTKGFSFLGRNIRFGVLKTIKRHQPELIFCEEFNPVTLVVFLYTKIFHRKIKVYTMTDDCIRQAKERKGIRAFLRTQISKHSAGVIYTSKDVANWHVAHISADIKPVELPIVHNEMVIQEVYKNSLVAAENNIKEFSLLGNKIILFVGRLVAVKNIPLLINAVSKIEEKNFLIS